MTKQLLGTVAAAGLAVFAAPAFALTTLTIDDFDGSQRVTDEGGDSASQVAGDMLGGYRDLQVENTVAEGDATDATELRVTAGSLRFSNIRGARGEGIITYDGDDDPTTLNTTGLGGINLLIGPSPRFFFDVPPDGFDNNANAFFAVDAYDMNGNQVSYTENLQAGFNPFLPFDQLTGDEGFDFGAVGALQFRISTTNTIDNIDGEIRAIEVAAIPLPASGLLLLAGLGGVGAVRRFRKG